MFSPWRTVPMTTFVDTTLQRSIWARRFSTSRRVWSVGRDKNRGTTEAFFSGPSLTFRSVHKGPIFTFYAQIRRGRETRRKARIPKLAIYEVSVHWVALNFPDGSRFFTPMRFWLQITLWICSKSTALNLRWKLLESWTIVKIYKIISRDAGWCLWLIFVLAFEKKIRRKKLACKLRGVGRVALSKQLWCCTLNLVW